MQNMNVMLNMKDINKILAKTHFKYKKKNNVKKTHIFAKTCLYDAVGSLPVKPSLLPHGLLREKSSLPVFCKCGEPWYSDAENLICQYDVEYIMVLPIKIIMSVMKVSTYIITSITALSIRLDAILVVMSVSIFKSDIILYVSEFIL